MPIHLYNNDKPSQPVIDQICQMVADYMPELSMYAMPDSNRLYELYEWALVSEVHIYMTWLGRQPELPPVELLVAFDEANPHLVVGFLMYLPIPSHPGACGVTYMAVLKSHRGQGIGSNLLRTALGRYPQAGLSCPVEKVAFYERLGFQVLGPHFTQVEMNTQDAAPEGQMQVVDFQNLLNSPISQSIQLQLLQEWGPAEMQDAQRLLRAHVSELSAKAEAFAKTRTNQLRNRTSLP